MKGVRTSPHDSMNATGVAGLADMMLAPWSLVSRRGMFGLREAREG